VHRQSPPEWPCPRYPPIHQIITSTNPKKKDCLSRALLALPKRKPFPFCCMLIHSLIILLFLHFIPFPLLHVLLSSDGEPGDWLFGWIFFGFCFCFALLFLSELGYNERRSRSYDDESMGIKNVRWPGNRWRSDHYRTVLTHTRWVAAGWRRLIDSLI
jgi:hypothetical protein